MKQIKAILRPIVRRVSLMIARGVLELSDDSTKIQLMQLGLLADEVKDQVESMGHFGFSSRPPKGSDVIMVSVGAAREHGVVIATEHREYRFKNLGEGEAVLYSKDGDKVHLKNGNIIDVETSVLNINATTSVNITSPEFNVTASSKAKFTTPEIDASAKISAGGDIESATKVKAPIIEGGAITAASSLIVAGQELNGYEAHQHEYQDTGAMVNPSTTDVVK